MLEISFGFALIAIVFAATKFVFDLISLRFPPSIGGMFVLFLLMSFGLVPLKPVTAACTILLKHMQIFFAPILVSLFFGNKIAHLQLLVLVILLIASTFATFAITAWGVEIVQRLKSRKADFIEAKIAENGKSDLK